MERASLPVKYNDTYSKKKLTAIILAGGKSSRMGQDKAVIPIDGVPILMRVYQVAACCADTVYIVTPWQERYQDLLPPSCQFIHEVPFEGDINAGSPLVGFAEALVQVSTEWVLLLACDLPYLRVEVLQAWIEGLENIRAEAIAALAKNGKGWEPLCGFYRKSCLAGLKEFISIGGRSFQQWLNQNPVDVLLNPHMEMFFNCNTPEDLRHPSL